MANVYSNQALRPTTLRCSASRGGSPPERPRMAPIWLRMAQDGSRWPNLDRSGGGAFAPGGLLRAACMQRGSMTPFRCVAQPSCPYFRPRTQGLGSTPCASAAHRGHLAAVGRLQAAQHTWGVGESPGHRAPSHCLGCSSWPPPSLTHSPLAPFSPSLPHYLTTLLPPPSLSTPSLSTPSLPIHRPTAPWIYIYIYIYI